jgi:hypothetical protein
MTGPTLIDLPATARQRSWLVVHPDGRLTRHTQGDVGGVQATEVNLDQLRREFKGQPVLEKIAAAVREMTD